MSARISEKNYSQSNRPYTLSYYPSSRLPPRTISEDEACRFWCLFDRQEPQSSDGEEERELPFSVNASLKWDVDQLTEAIQQERPLFRNIGITDLVLWKVRAVSFIGMSFRANPPSQLNDPIPIDPDPTLAERLPKPVTDFSVKLDRRTRKMSDVLPDCPEGHLHIIVRLRGKQIDRHLCMQD